MSPDIQGLLEKISNQIWPENRVHMDEKLVKAVEKWDDVEHKVS